MLSARFKPWHVPLFIAKYAYLRARRRPVLVHFDVDVIDSTEFPLADFPHFNQGLGYADALACLRVFGRHEAFGGLVLTEVNPHRDPDGRLTARLAADVAEATFRQISVRAMCCRGPW